MTAITEEAALKRFHQGHAYLLGLAAASKDQLDQSKVVGVVSIMAYLGAYAFPDRNLHGLMEVMSVALKPLSGKMDIKHVIDTAADNAEVFRRPWTEEPPRGQHQRTI